MDHYCHVTFTLGIFRSKDHVITLHLLKKWIHLGITYKNSNVNKISLYKLIKYVNDNYTSNSKDYNSVIRHNFFINGAIIF